MRGVKETNTFLSFFLTYCDNKHQSRKKKSARFPFIEIDQEYILCEECELLAATTLINRFNCPIERKIPCKRCTHNCHGPKNKSKVRKVMIYSSLRTLLRRG